MPPVPWDAVASHGYVLNEYGSIVRSHNLNVDFQSTRRTAARGCCAPWIKCMYFTRLPILNDERTNE
jgi:hypothetical protein